MSSMSLTLPLVGSKARAVLFETDTGLGLSLTDGGGNRIGKTVMLNRAQVSALRTCPPEWQASMIWALLGKGKLGPRKPLASTICHPGLAKVA
jgi:hypothetical protein